MKKLTKAVVGCVALTMVAIGVVASKSATEAKAFDFFDKDSVSIKKCAKTLENDSFEWTGREIKPSVRENYKGTDLEKGVDYVVEYRNIISGKGKYEGAVAKYVTTTETKLY